MVNIKKNVLSHVYQLIDYPFPDGEFIVSVDFRDKFLRINDKVKNQPIKQKFSGFHIFL